ncbi:hypothetical protein V8E54_009624 [Elaphomyces granulatus]
MADISPQQTDELLNSIKETILSTTESCDLYFENIPPTAGFHITSSFREDPEIESALPRYVIHSNLHRRVSYNSYTRTLKARVHPTFILDSHQGWFHNEILHMFVSGFLTGAEHDQLCFEVGTSRSSLHSPRFRRPKEPEGFIRPFESRANLPTIAVETGWSESWPILLNEKDLWLLGGAPDVQLVFLIVWTQLDGNRVQGDLYVYGRDVTGAPILMQAEQIFPVSPGNPPQLIYITRSQLFGTTVPLDRNPNDIYALSIDNFRRRADPSIRRMGFTPA